MTWRERAACRDAPTELFFDGDLDEAKAYCERCEVRTECLEDALTVRHYRTVGVWGGVSDEQRQKMRPPLTPRSCDWCDEKFQPAHPHQRFHHRRCASSMSSFNSKRRRAS